MDASSTLINNRYRVVRELGRGGFGATFLVEDTQLPSGKYCVLKELLPIDNNEETYTLIKQRFEREAVILEELGSMSSQIPSLYAYFTEATKFYLVQEYFEGETIGQRVMSQGVMSDASVRQWLSGILPVLESVHQKRIVHRDIKPENIILRQRDHQPVLIDFGAVRETMGMQVQPNGESTKSIVIGTPGFMPSEQAAGRAVFGSDLYSLGLTAVYALTGKLPQDLPTNPMTGDIEWRRYAPMVSVGLATVIDQSIAPGTQSRFQTSAQMLNALLSTDAPTTGMPGTVMSMPNSGVMPTQVTTAPPSGSYPAGPYPTGPQPTMVVPPSNYPPQPQSSYPPQPQSSYPPQSNYSSQPQTGYPQKPDRRKWALMAVAAIGVLGLGALGGKQLLGDSGKDPKDSKDSEQRQDSVQLVASCPESKLVRKQGNVYGTVEIGSKGVKGAVIQELPSADTEGFKFVARKEKIESRNVNAVKPDAQKETVQAVNDLFRELQSRFNIPCEQIVIFGSSGVAQKAPHKDKLAEEIRQKTGRAVTFISPEDEAIMTFEGIVPEWRRGDVTLVDIGSGNSKGAFLQSTQKSEYNTFVVPLGTTTFTDKVNEVKKNRSMGTFTEAAAIAKREELIPPIQEIVQRKPGFQNTSRVYLSGGISWALSTLTRPCEPEQSVDQKSERVSRFSRLTVEDINTFYTNATRDRANLFKPDLSACDEERRKRVIKDIERIQKDTFSEDNLIAGAEILRSFSDSLNFASKDKVFFSQDAISALPTGFLIRELKRIEKPAG